MSFSGHNSVDAPFGMPRITTERASDSNFSYHSSLPSQALIPHQTSLSQVKGRVSARKTGDTASNPCEKKKAKKRALARERGPSIKLIPGFDHWSKSLPKDLEHEDIIKKYPNHLHGELLLEIAATWSPKEISEACGRPELTSNTLVKRIKAAKCNRDGLPARSGKSKKALGIAHPPAATTSSVQLYQTDVSNTFVESEASLKFLTEQEALREIISELDPKWMEGSINSWGKRKSSLEPKLLELAMLELERRKTLA